MDKQEAIERLKQNKAAAEFYAGMIDNYKSVCNELKDIEAFDMAIEALSEPKIGWIPVSEKLPETGDSILVTYSDEEVGIVWDARPKAWETYIESNNLIYPIAWMPLPEPYRTVQRGW